MKHILYLLFCITLFAGCDPQNQNAERDSEKIDRFDLVNRHNVELTSPDTLASLSVGNGEFAFTVDVTGLQSFPEYYDNGISLGTQSQWGWHVIPTDENYQLEEVVITRTSCDGEEIPFPVQHSEGRKADATNWLRTNPHRLHLGMIGLEMLKENGEKAEIHDLENIDQTLNLWTGGIESRYEIEGVPVVVELYGHQENDQIAVRIAGELEEQGKTFSSLVLGILLAVFLVYAASRHDGRQCRPSWRVRPGGAGYGAAEMTSTRSAASPQ